MLAALPLLPTFTPLSTDDETEPEYTLGHRHYFLRPQALPTFTGLCPAPPGPPLAVFRVFVDAGGSSTVTSFARSPLGDLSRARVRACVFPFDCPTIISSVLDLLACPPQRRDFPAETLGAA